MRQNTGASRPETEFEREFRLWPKAPRVHPFRFRQAPLLIVALCFALGASLTKLPLHWSRPTLLFASAALVLCLLSVAMLRTALRFALTCTCLLWIVVGCWSARIEPEPARQTAMLRYADGLSRQLQGRVLRVRELPARSNAHEQTSDFDWDGWDEQGTPTRSVDIAVTAIEDVTPDTSRMVPIAGGIRTTLLGDSTAVHLRCGEMVDLPVRLRVPERYRDPGAWQYADYLLQQGIAATATVPAARLVHAPEAGTPPLRLALQCRVFAAQSWAAGRLLAYGASAANRRLSRSLRLAPDDIGMLNAMLFGDRTRLTHALRIGFERTGSFHLFVVSGMHVALLAGLVLWFVRRMRLNEALATAITVVLISAFALLAGFGVPVQRGLLMSVVFLSARLLSREHNALNALGAAGLAVLIWSPRALFEASFQMTFLAIVAIAGIAIPLGDRTFLPYAKAARNLRDIWKDTSLPPRLAHFRVMLRFWSEQLRYAGVPQRTVPALIRAALWILELALVGLVAEAVMILPMALYFHRATVFALPANLASIPLVGILVPLGLLTFLASLLSPWLAMLPSSALALILHGIAGVIGRIGHVQLADLRVPGPRLLEALLAVACIGFCGWAVRRSPRLAIAAVALLPVAAALVLWPERPITQPGRLEVTAIDVGQGDSLVVVAPNGHAMLIDAGGPTGAAANAENAKSTAAFDVGEEVVSPYLWSRQFRRLDVIALSHAHSDHMGGMAAALRNFRPRELWVGVDPNSAAYRDLLAEAASLGVTVRHLRAGDRLAWNGVDVSVLAPAAAYSNPGPPVNNDSLVLRLRFGAATALLEGDAESPSEHAMTVAALNGTGPAIGPDTLLKVGHHGSRTSTTPEFLALTAPKDAVISVGAQNTFGHPRPEIVERLHDAHAQVYRTDEFGLTRFLLSPDGGIAALPFASNH